MTARERHQRADGQIDAAGDDDERAGDRQHAVDRRRLQNPEHVVHLHERGRGEAEKDQQQDQAPEGEQLLQSGRREEAGAQRRRPRLVSPAPTYPMAVS